MMFEMFKSFQDKVLNEFSIINGSLTDINVNLSEHMRRTEIAEARIDCHDAKLEKLEAPHKNLKFLGSLVKDIVFVIGGIYVVLQIVKIVEEIFP